MKSGQKRCSLLFSIVMAAIAVLITSFSPQSSSPVLPASSLVSASAPTVLLQSDFYSPEFDLKADSVIIPMKRAGRLFLIEAKVDGEIGNLVFDTGANRLVLNSTYFRNHVKSGGSNSNGITGAVATVEQITVGKFEFADLIYENVRADVANLGHIENRRGVKIIGLIGFSMIRNLEIVIDPQNSELKLFRIDKTGKRLNNSLPGFKPDYSQKVESTSNILFLKGIIGDKTLNFCFDTGAETNAISSDSNKKVLNTLTITRRVALKGAGAAGSEVLFGRMNDFKIGDQKIQNMETIITNLDALSEAYNTRIDGMLGYSFLEHGIVCVNFVNKQFGIRFLKGDAK